MKILELFCGTKSFSKVAEELGHETFTVDFNPKFKPDMVADMLYFNMKMLPKEWRKPDYIHMSPPCETFSLSGNSWFMGFPATPKAYIGMALAYKCVEIALVNPQAKWSIENPRGGLRSAWFMKPLPRTTVTYCQYGFNRMKPTDIWNNYGFEGRMCNNGDGCHESAPRGSKTGTQGEKHREDRYKIPSQLCKEMLLKAFPQTTFKNTDKFNEGENK